MSTRKKNSLETDIGPKITRRERRQMQLQARRAYYARNREREQAESRERMKKLRERRKKELYRAQAVSFIEEDRLKERRRACLRGTRMHAIWPRRRSTSEDVQVSRDSSVSPEPPTPSAHQPVKLHDFDRGYLYQLGYFEWRGRWIHPDEPDPIVEEECEEGNLGKNPNVIGVGSTPTDESDGGDAQRDHEEGPCVPRRTNTPREGQSEFWPDRLPPSSPFSSDRENTLEKQSNRRYQTPPRREHWPGQLPPSSPFSSSSDIDDGLV